MAVVDVKEVWDGRGGSFGEDHVRSYTRRFRVITDADNTETIDVGWATGIPRMYSPYKSPDGTVLDNLARVVKVDPQQDASDPKIWFVDVEYRYSTSQVGADVGGPIGGGSGEPTKPGGGGGGDQPESRPWKIDLSVETMMRSVRKGYTAAGVQNVPIVNSAGDPFADVQQIEVGYLVLNVQRTVVSFDALLAVDMLYSVNNAPWWIASPGYAQLTHWSASRTFIGGSPYWEESLKVRIAPAFLPGWNLELLDCGYRQLNSGYGSGSGNGSGNTMPILEPGTVQPVSEVWPLDGAGRALTRDQLIAGLAFYKTFRIYPARDFNLLNL